jgi:Ulp1 family protease
MEVEDAINLRDDPKFWLNDRVVTFSLKLLRSQFPHVGALFDTTALACRGRSKRSYVPNKTCVQIMNVGRVHWIAAGRADAEIVLVDSLNSLEHPLDSELIRQLLNIFVPEDLHPSFDSKTIRIEKLRIPQIGGSDCGLFSIAIAEALCRGLPVSKMTFDQSKMRGHLFHNLFQEGVITPFP